MEVPGAVNTVRGLGDIWGALMELYLFLCVCVPALRASALDIPGTGIEFVGLGKQGCALPSPHLELPYTLVTNKINTV